MQDILTCAMGLDIHRDVIVACLAKGELGTDPEIEIRSFSTLIPEMRKLRDWVLEAECRYVAMESTGIYWQPIPPPFPIHGKGGGSGGYTPVTPREWHSRGRP